MKLLEVEVGTCLIAGDASDLSNNYWVIYTHFNTSTMEVSEVLIS